MLTSYLRHKPIIVRTSEQKWRAVCGFCKWRSDTSHTEQAAEAQRHNHLMALWNRDTLEDWEHGTINNMYQPWCASRPITTGYRSTKRRRYEPAKTRQPDKRVGAAAQLHKQKADIAESQQIALDHYS